MEGINYYNLTFYPHYTDNPYNAIIKAPDYWSQREIYNKLDKHIDVHKIDSLNIINELNESISYKNICFDFIQFPSDGIKF